MAEAGLLDEIFVALGFKVDDKKVKDFKGNIDSAVGSMRRLATVAIGAVTVLDRMTNALMKANQAYISFNQQTGISIDAINRVANAGMLANYNLSPQTMMSSIQALQSNLAAIRLGQGNIAPFQMLGISPIGKDAIQVIEELRSAISGLDDMTATNLIQQMGLSPEFMSYLRMSTEQVQMLSAAAQQFTLTAREREDLQSFALQMRLIHMEMSYVKDKTLIELAPALTKLLRFFTNIAELLLENKNLIIWLGAAGVGKIMLMNKSIKILGVTINRTFGKWLAILTALLLVLEDIAVWRQGGLSALGDLLNSKPVTQTKERIDEHKRKVESSRAHLPGTGESFLMSMFDRIMGQTLFATPLLAMGSMQKMFSGQNSLNPTNNTQNQTINQTNYLDMGQNSKSSSAANILTQQLYEAAYQIGGGR